MKDAIPLERIQNVKSVTSISFPSVTMACEKGSMFWIPVPISEVRIHVICFERFGCLFSRKGEDQDPCVTSMIFRGHGGFAQGIINLLREGGVSWLIVSGYAD